MHKFWVSMIASASVLVSSQLMAADTSDALEPDQITNLPLEDIRRFTEVFDRIKKAYVEPVSDEKLLEDAVRGMLDGLDPHSTYLAADQYSELQIQTSGQFGGVGIEISQEDGVIRVITPIDDTPAMEAGIQAGDLIIKIDSKIIQSIGVEAAIALMRGKPGSEIVLSIVRGEGAKPFEVTLKRALINVTSIRSRFLEPELGYIRISQFQHQTASDLNQVLKKMQQDLPLKGLVLDLRNNPGGVLRGAVDVTDAFIDKGVIVSTKGRLASSQMSFEATQAMSVDSIPIVVLINGGSASASEIVAGALQDSQRAIVMGTSSFGKGSVQTVLQLSEKRAIKLTTARYFTPSGRSIQAKGIDPDIVVEQAQVKAKRSFAGVREKDLNGHLINDQQVANAVAGSSLIETDFQLYEALNLLKGLVLVSSSKR